MPNAMIHDSICAMCPWESLHQQSITISSCPPLQACVERLLRARLAHYLRTIHRRATLQLVPCFLDPSARPTPIVHLLSFPHRDPYRVYEHPSLCSFFRTISHHEPPFSQTLHWLALISTAPLGTLEPGPGPSVSLCLSLAASAFVPAFVRDC